MDPEAAAEAWNIVTTIASGLVGAVSVGLIIYMRLRQIARETKRDKDEQKEREIREAVRKDDIEKRLTELEAMQSAQRERDSREHAEIKDAVTSGIRDVMVRIDKQYEIIMKLVRK